MKPVTIITGPLCSGKSTKAKELIGNRKAEWFTSPAEIQHKRIDADTEVFVIDEVHPKDLERLKVLISVDKYRWRGLYATTAEIRIRKELIIISNYFTKDDFEPRSHITFIEMPKAAEPNY
jgi:tRNA uridine 5-carbamoylmethylation protein Kti12